METRLPNIFKTANVPNFTRAILKSSYTEFYKLRSNRKRKKKPVYFLKAVEFCSTFWQSNFYNFGYILGKVAKPHFLESPQKSLKTHEHPYQ